MRLLDLAVNPRLPRLSLIAGILAVALLSMSFLAEPSETNAETNLAQGRLIVGTRTMTFSGQPTFSLLSSNSDGSGQAGVGVLTPSPIQPTWSGDGTRIAYVGGSSPTEIYAANADGSNAINLTQSSASESNPSWSSTGKIAYERDSQIWTMNQDGTGQTQFMAITQPSPTGPSFSSDGSKIVFASAGEIWKINADGTNEVRVTNNATSDSDPAWSPDSSKIVFSRGSAGISVIDASGANESNLTAGFDLRPVWSADGTTIAFKRIGTASGIYVMDATGANEIRIIADGGGVFSATFDDPAWQPVAQVPNTFSISGYVSGGGSLPAGALVTLAGTSTGTTTTDAIGNYRFSGLAAGGNYSVSVALANYSFTPPSRAFNSLAANQTADFVGKEVCFGASCARNGRIAFVSGSTIFSINPNGSDRRTVTEGTFPNYSPDGTKITFASTRDGNNEIYSANADGTNPLRLTNNSSADIQPYYSPNGASIVFTSNRDGNEEIYKMNADGSNQVRLTNEASSDRMPAFSPDGQKIIFVTNRLGGSSNHRLFTMNADGANQQVISDVSGVYFRPSYRPDGAKIVFGYGQFEPMFDIWTMNADGSGRAIFLSNRVENPAYSPDGTRVVYKCCGNIEVDINGIHITGGGRITNSIGDDWPTWQRIYAPRRTAFDFDGDGRSDVSVFRSSDRVWYLLRSQAGFVPVQWGLSTDVIAPADYDGDLKTDVAIWRASEGNFYVLNSFDSTFRIENLGASGDVPMPQDWDGDSRADLTLYRGGAAGHFYYRPSMANPSGNTTAVHWGTTGDKPVTGDYDGDGKGDAAVYRPSSGVWYIVKSSDGSFRADAFGLANDKLVPADYDADGRTDLAVYREGTWYLLRSTEGFAAFSYGLPTDIPVPADYDGDGRADPSVYRDGTWYRIRSTGGSDVLTFGLSTDKPVPAAFVN